MHATLKLETTPATQAAQPLPAAHGALLRLGLWVQGLGRESLRTASFVGEVLLATLRLLRGKSAMRGVDLWRQIDLTGPLSLPIVALTCFLVGLMLAYMGGSQLGRMGAQVYIADIVTVGMVRELAGLMMGMILAGRVGSAYAAQIATMKAGEEIDALRVLGVDPIDHLVIPRLLALVIVAPLIMAYASAVGVLAGLIPATLVYGVSAAEYLQRAGHALTWSHVWIGLFKGTLYAALLSLAGCREGLYAGRSAQAGLGKAVAHVVASLRKTANKPSRRAGLLATVKSLLGESADAQAVQSVLAQLSASGAVTVDAAGAVRYALPSAGSD